MEKLRSYVATVREKFQPTLTPEASDLLYKHYNLCRQQNGDGQTIVTVRFLESLMRLSQAHARLMYRDQVLLDDAVAVILLMECSAASSTGIYSGNGSTSFDFDDCFLHKSPIDTEFPPFDQADIYFANEKQSLLQRYERSDNGSPAEPSPWRDRRQARPNSWDDAGTSHGEAYRQSQLHNREDQWGRQRFSQATSPRYLSQGNAADANQQWTQTQDKAGSILRRNKGNSGNRVTFTQERCEQGDWANRYHDQRTSQHCDNPDELESNQQESSGNRGAFAPGFEPEDMHATDQSAKHDEFTQQSSSGNKRKKRRTAD